MHEHDDISVEVSPFQAQGVLSGFLVSGRWPASTVEWARFLLLAVRVASVPGMLLTSTVFRVREERPESMHPGAVGLVLFLWRQILLAWKNVPLPFCSKK